MKENTPSKAEPSEVDDGSVDLFDLHLPNRVGYIRPLDIRDQYYDYYESGLFGLFHAEDGRILATVEGKDNTFKHALKNGYVAYGLQ